MQKKGKKITILGVGNVGATIAYTLALEGLAAEIVLIDINRDKAKGEAMDILQGMSVGSDSNIYAGDYEAAANSDIIIVTVGMARKPGQSRTDLAQCNVNIIKQVMPQISQVAPDAIYIVVSNPVDIITYAIFKCTDLKKEQVFGTGTMLDTARLRTILAERIGVNSKNIHAYVLGEHGDSSIVPWSLTSISGMKMREYCEICPNHNRCDDNNMEMIEADMRTSGGKIIAWKGATYYAIAMVTKKAVESIFNNARTTLTVSTLLCGEYGIDDVCISLPCIVGDTGINRILTPKLEEKEELGLQNSANTLKKVLSSINI